MSIFERVQTGIGFAVGKHRQTSTPWPVRSTRKGPYPIAATISFFLFMTALAVAVNVARSLEIGA